MEAVSSSEEPIRITYGADWEPGEIAGIDGAGLKAGQRVILVQPEGVTEEPLEWPGIVEEVRERAPGRWWAGVRMAYSGGERAFPAGFLVSVDETGEFSVNIEDLPVSGRDGGGRKTPTVRELAVILAALPGQFQDLPVSRYCDEGICGISYRLHYEHEELGKWTAHVGLW
jgi:hypothetical protein